MNKDTKDILEQQRALIAAGSGLFESAYDEAQNRVKAIQGLTQQIGQAKDPKAILDLQAMIETEQGQLAIEQNKIQAMTQRLDYEERLLDQALRERAINSAGKMRGSKF